jgi:non-homologous end joining protein Ku
MLEQTKHVLMLFKSNLINGDYVKGWLEETERYVVRTEEELEELKTVLKEMRREVEGGFFRRFLQH